METALKHCLELNPTTATQEELIQHYQILQKHTQDLISQKSNYLEYLEKENEEKEYIIKGIQEKAFWMAATLKVMSVQKNFKSRYQQNEAFISEQFQLMMNGAYDDIGIDVLENQGGPRREPLDVSVLEKVHSDGVS